jgi:hypothetical protein
MQERDDGYAIRVGLLAVIAFMSWPVWLAIVSGQHSFTLGVALSALVPLALTIMLPAVAFHAGRRMHNGLLSLEHRLHIDSFIDHHLHRHA